jgi:hypothetical protein
MIYNKKQLIFYSRKVFFLLSLKNTLFSFKKPTHKKKIIVVINIYLTRLYIYYIIFTIFILYI